MDHYMPKSLTWQYKERKSTSVDEWLSNIESRTTAFPSFDNNKQRQDASEDTWYWKSYGQVFWSFSSMDGICNKDSTFSITLFIARVKITLQKNGGKVNMNIVKGGIPSSKTT